MLRNTWNRDRISPTLFCTILFYGVPITFIDHYNPRQFKILGLDKDFTSDKKEELLMANNFMQEYLSKTCVNEK